MCLSHYPHPIRPRLFVFLGGGDESEATAAEAIGGIRWWVELRETEHESKPATLQVPVMADWKDVATIVRENGRSAAIQ